MMNIPNNLYRAFIGFLLLTTYQTLVWSQDEQKAIVKKPILSLKYFNEQNQMQYLVFQCQLKVDKKIEPVSKLGIKIYLDDETNESNLLGKFITNEEGKANTVIPISFKDKWIQSSQHKFIAVTDSISGIGVREAEAEITISRITLDTVAEEDSRKVMVLFEEHKDNKWSPVKDVEVRLGVKRLGSILSIGEGETVTTDSSGKAIAEFTRDSLPGDVNGNLILIAKVEDNETYGNLISEKSVSWGKAYKSEFNIDNRSLWATGNKVPIWLLSIAILIICSVWGTLIYLVFRVLKIRKLGISR